MKRPTPYQAYLIRLWPTVRRGVPGCRVSLESVSTGECRNFPGLDELLTFLRLQEGQRMEQRGVEHDQEGGDL